MALNALSLYAGSNVKSRLQLLTHISLLAALMKTGEFVPFARIKAILHRIKAA